MKLKSFKTIQILYVVVSASSLMTACNTKIAEPLKLTAKQETGLAVENYGVPLAQSVLFSNSADDVALDFTF